MYAILACFNLAQHRVLLYYFCLGKKSLFGAVGISLFISIGYGYTLY